MEFKVLGCYGAEMPGYQLSSFLIDGRLLLDAGAVSATLKLKDQVKVDYLLLTHVHLDHIKGISFLADNVYGLRKEPIVIASIEPVISDLKKHLLNDILWPDFTRLPNTNTPVVVFETLDEEIPHPLGKYTVRAVKVNHTVAAVGFFVRGRGSTLLYTGDTGPTDRVWEVAMDYPDLKAVIVETSFPNKYQEIADFSDHLTPQTLKVELEKLDSRLESKIPVYLYHAKPQYLREINQEVRAIKRPNISILKQGKVYYL